eukprot:350136-Chlamydomonas_euryale.AAC.20
MCVCGVFYCGAAGWYAVLVRGGLHCGVAGWHAVTVLHTNVRAHVIVRAHMPARTLGGGDTHEHGKGFGAQVSTLCPFPCACGHHVCMWTTHEWGPRVSGDHP